MRRIHEQLVEVFEITEYRDGAVYGTRSLGEKWIPLDVGIGRVPGTNIEYVPVSTARAQELDWKTMRTRMVEDPVGDALWRQDARP